jgi:hypothetical protein
MKTMKTDKKRKKYRIHLIQLETTKLTKSRNRPSSLDWASSETERGGPIHRQSLFLDLSFCTEAQHLLSSSTLGY